VSIIINLVFFIFFGYMVSTLKIIHTYYLLLYYYRYYLFFIMFFLKKIIRLKKKHIHLSVYFLKLYNLYLMVKFFFIKTKKIMFFNLSKKTLNLFKKNKKNPELFFLNKFKKNKSIYKKKKKIKKKKNFLSFSNFSLLKKLKYHRYFNYIIKKESQHSKNDIRGKYSSSVNYLWCVNFISAKYLLLIQIKNIFKKKGYFRLQKNINNIKKKTNNNSIVIYDNSINWFQKWKILNTILNNTLIPNTNIYLFYKNTILSIYLNNKPNLIKNIKKELIPFNLNLNQIEIPSRFFNKKKNTHSIWK